MQLQINIPLEIIYYHKIIFGNYKTLLMFMFVSCFHRLEQINPKAPVRFLPHTRPMDNCLARIKKRSAV